MNTLSSVDNAYSIVIQEESHCVIAREQGSRVEVVVFVARTTKKIIYFMHCCNKQGDPTIDYFQVIGYPKWWLEKEK